MTAADTLHIEPTPIGWVAYYDPEGLNGHGKTKEDALTELLEQTDERWRKALDEQDVMRRSISEAETERDAFRTVLEGMEFQHLDTLKGRGMEFCRAVGVEARRQIITASSSLLESVLAINSAGTARETTK